MSYHLPVDISGTMIRLLVFGLFLSSGFCLTDKCSVCKTLTTQFDKKIKETEKSNFGGGNSHWEEKSLGNYVYRYSILFDMQTKIFNSKFYFSETRLVEIMEDLCPDKHTANVNCLLP
jgi:hypothetical protein